MLLAIMNATAAFLDIKLKLSSFIKASVFTL